MLPEDNDTTKKKADDAAYRERNREAIKERARIWREKNRQHTRDYMKSYRDDNKPRLKQINKESRLRNIEKYKAYNLAYAKADSDKALARTKKYQAANKDKVKAAYQKYRAENPDKVNAATKAYRKRYPDRYREQRRASAAASKFRRRSRLKNAGTFTQKQIRELYIKQAGKCATCKCKITHIGTTKYHIDHVMPVAKNGLNVIENIQLLCAPCNCKKKAMHPDEWAKMHGLLFC